MKKTFYGYLAVFALLIALPFGLRLTGLELGSSAEFEQRELAEKPKLSLGEISRFPGEYEAYFNDSLPFREQLIRLNNRLNYSMLSGSSALTLVQGQDGWLFYNPAGADGDPMADYYNSPRLTEDFLRETADTLIGLRDMLAARSCDFVMMLAPNKATLYGTAYFPFYYPRNNGETRGDQAMQYLAERTDLKLVYPKEALLAEVCDRLPIVYYRQDTHWNHAGAYVGARELLKKLDITLPALSELELQQSMSTIRDLAAMTSLADTIPPEPEYTPVGYSDRIAEFTSDDGGDAADEDTVIIRSRCPGADPRKLLVIRDSFCTAMMEPLSTQFTDCVFVKRRLLTKELLDAEQPDIVVYESAERFLYKIREIDLSGE